MPAQSLNVLIVEDNPQDAELVLAALQQGGFDPIWQRVETEADFLAKLHAGLDLVLSDYSLPRFSGLRALELLKKHQPYVPLILISGTIGEDAAVEAMRLGATDYLLKDRLVRLGPAVQRVLQETRLRREQWLREEDFRLLFSQNPMPMWVYDRESLRFLAVNEAAIQHYGYTREEFLGLTLKDIRPPEEVPRLLESLRARATIITKPGIWLHRRKDGTRMMMETTAHRTTFHGQNAELVLANDVTERLAAVEQMRASEARYRALFEYAPDGIVIDDGRGRYLDANASACRMFGYTRAEFVGLGATDIVVPTEAPRLPDAIESIKQGDTFHQEWQFRRKDGSTFAAEVMATAMPDGNFMAMIRDITDRKQAEEAIHAQLSELRRWHIMTLGREEHVINLKREINELLARQGQPRRYTSPDAPL